jgi:hypothetical protein
LLPTGATGIQKFDSKMHFVAELSTCGDRKLIRQLRASQWIRRAASTSSSCRTTAFASTTPTAIS